MFKTYLIQYKHLIKEGSWVFIGQVSVAIISLIGLRILTEIAPANLLGGATLLLGVLTLLRNIFIAPIGNTQIRFHPEYVNTGHAKWFDKNIKKLYFKLIFVSIIIYVVVFALWAQFSSYAFNFLLLLILILYYTLDALKSFKLNRLSAERRQKFAAIWQVIDTLLVNAFFITALLLVNNVESYLAGQTIGLLIGLVIFGFITFPRIENTQKDNPAYSEIKNKIVQYGLPFIPLAIVSWISNLGDRYIIGNYLSLNEVGIYTAVYSIASRPFLMIGGVISGFFRPILFQSESFKDIKKAKSVFNMWITILLLFAGIIFIGYLLLGETIISILLSENYRKNSYPIFILIGASYLIYGFVQTFESRLYSKNCTKDTILPSVVAAVLNITINFLLIPFMGINGAAFASLISFSIHLMALIITYRLKVSGKT